MGEAGFAGYLSTGESRSRASDPAGDLINTFDVQGKGANSGDVIRALKS